MILSCWVNMTMSVCNDFFFLSTLEVVAVECVCVCVCVGHLHCSAQLSMFNMEKYVCVSVCVCVCGVYVCACVCVWFICIVQRNWACLTWKSAIEVKSLLLLLLLLLLTLSSETKVGLLAFYLLVFSLFNGDGILKMLCSALFIIVDGLFKIRFAVHWLS